LLQLPYHKKQEIDKEGKKSAPTPETIALVTKAKKVMKIHNKRQKDALYGGHGFLDLLMSGGEGRQDAARNELAARIFQSLRENRVQEVPVQRPPRTNLNPARTVEADPTLVKNFVEMGFAEVRSKRALVHFANNFESAMAYMLNNDESKDATTFRPTTLVSLRRSPETNSFLV